MADANNHPVIFLAFANDRDDTVGYLRNLPDEARRLRDVLQPAEQAGLCEVVVRSNSTVDDILKVFQDPKYRNRVGIFHYGGHANGYQLLLESAAGQTAAADAGGLAKFLGQQQGLELVFLNGCSTQQQTDGLLDANISAVISTSRAIDDQVATDFSHQFYQGLAGGATIRTAYNEAEAAVQTAKGGDTRSLYFGDKDKSESQLVADRWPWNLYLREGSETADRWNLPEAVNDPLFGLPPLPEQDLPESPYRHLNWFTRKDAEVFFGRGHQIRELHDRLTAPRTAPIMLFYGQSGVGKSSILDAGLIPRLEQDYEVHYLRRTEGGLLVTLGLAFLPEAAGEPIETAWRAKEEQTGKPLIVFLDQVEELYTRPNAAVPDELDQLLKVVKATFIESDQRPRGKLVLGFRKEWLAELEAQLVDHELPRTKVFLEPLDHRGIIEVVQGPSRSERLRERYGLAVEDGLAEVIADDLLADRDSAVAPTLQILLTKMWTKATEENYEHPQFSQDVYQHLKRDGILLRDFLNQQIESFREQYPQVVDSGLLLDIVALHTTPLGTADQRTVEHLQEQYAHLDATLPELLQQCQNLHLLTVATSAQKENAKATRLAHDTLAPLVREQFDVSDKPGQRARRILDNRSVDWQEDRKGTPLDEADLKVVEQGVTGTRVLSPTEQRLVQASRELRARLKRLRTMLKTAGAVAVAIVAVTACVALWQWSEAETAKVKAIDANAKTVEERDAKEVARKEADTKRDDALRLQSLFLADESERQLSRGDAVTAALLALEGLQDPEATDETQRNRPYVHGAYVSLESAWRGRREQVVLAGHDGWVTSAAFSPQDGARIVTASEDDTARVWDVATGELIATLSGHTDILRSAAFSLDGTHIVTASKDKTARVWDAATGDEIAILTGHQDDVKSAVFSEDGTRILTASHDSTARVWDTNSWDSQELRGSDRMNGAFFNSDHTQVLIASDDRSARIRDVTTGDVVQIFQGDQGDMDSEGHVDLVNSAEFSPDETRVVTASRDHTARVWDVATGKVLATLTGHRDAVWSATFSPDGSRILTASKDATARLWDAATGKQFQTFTGHEAALAAAAFSPDGMQIVTASDDTTSRVWKAAAGEAIDTLSGHKAAVNAAAFSPDGTRIVTASLDETAQVWNAATGELLVTLTGHEDSVNGIAFSPDGARIVTASGNTEARIWDAATGKLISSPMIGHWDWVVDAAFSPDRAGSRIVTASKDGSARLWSAATGGPLHEFTGHDGAVNSAAFSPPDGASIVTASHDKTARIWNVKTREVTRTLTGHDGPVRDAAFSPTGDRVVTASDDRTARLWDAKTGTLIRTFTGHKDKLLSAAFSPRDGARIVTASQDRTARIWDASTGEAIKVLQGHAAEVYSAAFSPDETRIVTASADNTVRIWDSVILDRQELIDQTRKGLHRCLTPKQRKQFFLAPEPPAWCIEMGKWPYDSKQWKQWLADKKEGREVEMPGAAEPSH